jgi:carboxymethylenebutenolidase
MIEFHAGDAQVSGYLALPRRGQGPGVLVLHAWWGLNDFFRSFGDRLASAGFVAFAPDLYRGATAATIDEARELLAKRDFDYMSRAAATAVDYLRQHPAVRGSGLGAVGFSMGAAWSLVLSSAKPDDIAAVVLFYGSESVDFARARAAYLGHFAEVDEWEPLDGVRQMEADMRAAGHEVTFHIYPKVGHWFFESNRPDAYNAEAAQRAWDRTVGFLRGKLKQE